MRQLIPALWIGNALDARDLTGVLKAGIEAIVDLALEEPPLSPTRELTYLRIPIVDGPNNRPARVRLAIETIESLVVESIPSLVACSAGMSRSPAIVAMALSRAQNIPFNDALAAVARNGPCDVSPALLADIVAAVPAATGRDGSRQDIRPANDRLNP